MIVVDIETSGVNPQRNGIWQIGALEIGNYNNTFLQESKIDKEDDIETAALTITGKTEEKLRDEAKQSQKELIENFFSWVSNITNKIFLAHNTQFDYCFLSYKAKKYELSFPFSHRTLDLHSFAFMKYFDVYGKFPIEEGKSAFNLSKILEFCGIEDKRIQMKDKEVKKGTYHNALEDAKLTAEALSRILEGKSLLPEYSDYKIPEHLKK